MKSFYDFSANSLQGQPVDFKQYEDKVVLVVNTASKCGFTPQYAGLQELYETYQAEGLEILGFPCNQFGNQEPGDADSIQNDCLVNYGVSFQMFEKIDVNGKNTHPVYKYLKDELPGKLGRSIKWNFAKFLIDADGKPVKRFSPNTKPEELVPHIKNLLEKRKAAAV